MITPRPWINNREKTLRSSVALESIKLIKGPHFLSDDPILNNNQRLRREREGRGSGCLDMQLCESCSSEDKPWLLNWNHLVRFNLFSSGDPTAVPAVLLNPALTDFLSTVSFVAELKCRREMSTNRVKRDSCCRDNIYHSKKSTLNASCAIVCDAWMPTVLEELHLFHWLMFDLCLHKHVWVLLIKHTHLHIFTTNKLLNNKSLS